MAPRATRRAGGQVRADCRDCERLDYGKAPAMPRGLPEPLHSSGRVPAEGTCPPSPRAARTRRTAVPTTRCICLLSHTRMSRLAGLTDAANGLLGRTCVPVTTQVAGPAAAAQAPANDIDRADEDGDVTYIVGRGDGSDTRDTDGLRADHKVRRGGNGPAARARREAGRAPVLVSFAYRAAFSGPKNRWRRPTASRRAWSLPPRASRAPRAPLARRRPSTTWCGTL